MNIQQKAEKINQLTEELKQLSANCKDPIDSDERLVFMGDDKQQVMRIGRELFELGGNQAMSLALSKVPNYDQSELSNAWDAVGDWKA